MSRRAGSEPAPDAASPSLVDELTALLGPQRVSTERADRVTYGRDMWTRGLLSLAAGQPLLGAPSAVVWPETAGEVAAIVALARRAGVPVVPFGAGSGVAGGVLTEGGIVVDMKRMRRLLAVDAERGLATFEPGLLGWHLEEQLNRRGQTLGHFPSSIMCSTAGGWLATRGAGQCSSKYGKIEDLVVDADLVTGTGQIVRARSGEGGSTDWAQLVVGSEGTLGFITRATCATRPAPAARKLRGYWFPDVDSGCAAIAHLMQNGLRPAVVRLYDEIDTLISGVKSSARGKDRHEEAAAGGLGGLVRRLGAGELGLPARAPVDFDELLTFLRPDAQRARGRVEKWLLQAFLTQAEPVNRLLDRLFARLAVGCQLVLGFEGEPALAAAEDELAQLELGRLGARDLGEEPGLHWLRHRYDVSFKMPRAFSTGAFTDTIEVATTWDRLPSLYRTVKAALVPHALVLAHFSHAYPDGCSIYFTLVCRAGTTGSLGEAAPLTADARVRLEADVRRYETLWQAAMQAALQVGATISHHHGIGRLKTPYMPAEHGASLGILQGLKRACDPDAVCVPGLLVPRELPTLLPNRAPASAPPPRADVETLRAQFGAERTERAGDGLRCRVTGAADVQAVLETARALGEQVRCGAAPADGGARIALDLSPLSQVGPISRGSLLCEAQAGVPLWRLEQVLRAQKMSIGGLGPRAWARTLGASLAAPRPGEAALSDGRLRDRRTQVTAVLASGHVVTAPPQPVPRRAAGPDLSSALIGGPGGDRRSGVGVILGATLRAEAFVPAAPWLSFALGGPQQAAQAVFAARALHGAAACAELAVLDRALVERVLGAADAHGLPAGGFVLLVRPAGPPALADGIAQMLRERLGPHVTGSAPLNEARCRELWRPDGLFDATASAERAAAFAAHFPPYERAVAGGTDELAALLGADCGARMVCGVHLRGLAVCTDAPPPLPAATPDEPPDADAVLGPSLLDALLGTPGGAHVTLV